MQYEKPAIDHKIDLEGALKHGGHHSGQRPRGSGGYL